MKLANCSIDRQLIGPVILADNFFTRLRGLLGRTFDGTFNGLLLRPCGEIHTMGMKYPIDVAFLNEMGEVISVHHAVPPGKPMIKAKNARMTLELPEGSIEKYNIELGSKVEF